MTSTKDNSIFPSSKVKQIMLKDPDLKNPKKETVELIRNATEKFTHYLFQKCLDESISKRRKAMNLSDFHTAVGKDSTLKLILGQFFVQEDDQKTINNKIGEEEDISEKQEENLTEEDLLLEKDFVTSKNKKNKEEEEDENTYESDMNTSDDDNTEDVIAKLKSTGKAASSVSDISDASDDVDNL